MEDGLARTGEKLMAEFFILFNTQSALCPHTQQREDYEYNTPSKYNTLIIKYYMHVSYLLYSSYQIEIATARKQSEVGGRSKRVK